MGTGLSIDLLKLSVKPTVAVPHAESAAESREAKLTVTASAAQAIRAELDKRASTTSESGFRVGVQGGGCSGLSYTMAFEDHPRPDDKVVEQDGVRVYCDPKSHVYLAGSELDYVRTLMRTGFEVRNNPQQKSSCSCGTSFSV